MGDKCPLSKENACSKYMQDSIYCNKGEWEYCGIHKCHVNGELRRNNFGKTIIRIR
jgi:hypothetical protein